MTKKKQDKVVVDLKKLLFASLKGQTGASRLLVFLLKKFDESGQNSIEFTLQELNAMKFYEDARKSISYIKKHVNLINDAKTKDCTETIFSITRSHRCSSFFANINPQIDPQIFVRGFRAFPEQLIKEKTKGRSKARDIAIGVFVFALEHLEELAKTGSFELFLKPLADVIWASSSPALKDMKEEAEKGIEKMFGLNENFTVVPHYYETNDPEEFFKKSSLTVKISGDVLKNLLAAFGLEPDIKKEVEPMKIPFEFSPAAGQINEFEGATPEEIATALEKIASAIRSQNFHMKGGSVMKTLSNGSVAP